MTTDEKARLELEKITDIKLISFKGENGDLIQERLILGIEEKPERVERNIFAKIKAKRNLGKIKKFLAYLGIIKKTKMINVNVLDKTPLSVTETTNIGIENYGEIDYKNKSIENFLKNNKGLKAYGIDGQEVGYIDSDGRFKLNSNLKLGFNETILHQANRVIAIGKDNKFLDLNGKVLEDIGQFTKKEKVISENYQSLGSIMKELASANEAQNTGQSLNETSQKTATINAKNSNAKLRYVSPPSKLSSRRV